MVVRALTSVHEKIASIDVLGRERNPFRQWADCPNQDLLDFLGNLKTANVSVQG